MDLKNIAKPINAAAMRIMVSHIIFSLSEIIF
jgi:hypothetical protein